MLRFKTFQKLYNGDYDWISELYRGLDNENIVETTMDAKELYKRFDQSIEISQEDGWYFDDGSKVEFADPSGFAKRIARIELPDDEKGLENYKDAKTFVSTFNDVFRGGKASGYSADIEILVDGKPKMIKFNALSKTQSLKGGLTAAEKTARQEGLAAVAIMMADTLRSSGKTFPEMPKILKDTSSYGSLNASGRYTPTNKTIVTKTFVDYFTQGRKREEVESLIGGKTFVQLMELLYYDSSWLDVTFKTAEQAYMNKAFEKSTQSGDKYDVHRGTDFMNQVYLAYKKMAEHAEVDSAIIKYDKWNPGDVWMVQNSKTEELNVIMKALEKTAKDTTKTVDQLIGSVKKAVKDAKISPTVVVDRSSKSFKSALHYYNWLIREWYDADVLKGISLKKFDAPTVSDYNKDPVEDLKNIEVEFDGFYNTDPNNPLSTKDVYIEFNVNEDVTNSRSKIHSYKIQLRSFDSKIQAIQGEIKGTHANHGKVGLGVIRYLFGIGKGDSDFREWRKALADVYKQKQVKKSKELGIELSMQQLSASGKLGMDDLRTKYQKDAIRLKRILVYRILLLNSYVFEVSRSVARASKKWDALPIDRLVSKIQALEVCAWLKHLQDGNEQGTMELPDGTIIKGNQVDIILKRIYFYASSRGNAETGAFSSKFMKIG